MGKFGVNWLTFIMFFFGMFLGFSIEYKTWWYMPLFFMVMFVQFYAIVWIERRTQPPKRKGKLK